MSPGQIKPGEWDAAYHRLCLSDPQFQWGLQILSRLQVSPWASASFAMPGSTGCVIFQGSGFR